MNLQTLVPPDLYTEDGFAHLNWLQENYKVAWKALSSPYRNDSCLKFFIKEGVLYALIDFGGFAGQKYKYVPKAKKWLEA